MMSAAVATPVQQQTSTTTVVERKRRRSRAAVTLFATANAILRVLGVNNSKSTASAVLKLHQINGHQTAPAAAVMPAAPPSPPPPKSAEGSPPRNGVGHHQTMTPQPARRSPRDFIFGRSIGEGSFSNVYLAKDIHSRKEYAIKVCDKRHIIRERKAEYIKREKEVLHMLSSCENGFVHLYCTFQDADNLYFVLSYAKNGELLPYINKVGSFDLACTRFYAAEILVALEKLHCRGIIHRDLKPENILLDEHMHILITDFGSAKILNEDSNLNSNEGELCERRNSFVGTAQYVSPELLKDKRASKVSDLWAFGCIIYQMVSGLPPFRDGSEYLIFQKILKLNYEFPEGFDETAKDLVEKLLVLDPCKRLGIEDEGPTYESVRSHPFFDGIEWDTLYKQTPPDIYPYLPGRSADEELRSQYRVPDHLEPGLDDKQLTRLFGLELGIAETRQPKGICDISPEEIQRRLEKQKLDKWHPFVENNLILKQGFVNKRKGLFARKRMLLLTLGPRLFYVDPYNMVLKGEIPWSPELRVEPKNFKIFFVHTPNRTYYLEDPEGYALQWCKDIEDVRLHMYGKQQPK